MNAEDVYARRFAPVEQDYDWRDCALYALALGFGTELHSAASGTHLASLKSVHFLRGDGGCGACGDPRPGLPPIPADAIPDVTTDYATQKQAALLYRLASRDLMPLHADPEIARA